ncbi:hypothetical protein CASFOL_010836 [Castilleja foliolosa]|uniref:Uncharacterized protein n=1 Tax=Castilleja foliolosa TaxID=1961234 RepID=A0ABD3DXX2_9LAMI
MAAEMGFSNLIIRPILWSKGAKKHSLYAVPVYNSHQHHKAEINAPYKLAYTKCAIRRRPRKQFVVQTSKFNTNISPLSPAQTIVLFYSAINEKNLKQLDKMIANNCFFEDYSFPQPFRGKKFNVEHICEGNDNSVAVNWHLDWNKIQVPFTRGCSNYSLSVNVDKLVIEKAQIHIESPIKLGVIALTIFKTVSSLFDAFPAATEVLNKSTHNVPSTAKDIQDNNTSDNKTIPCMVHQVTRYSSFHSRLHTQNTTPGRKSFSQVNENKKQNSFYYTAL